VTHPPEEIKHVSHPHSKQQPMFQSFDEYVASNMAEQTTPTDEQPWRPFRSQLDFEVAEFCEVNMLNKDSTETLITLIWRCIRSSRFHLLSDLKCLQFEKGTITIQYKNEDKIFDTYTRPIWDWARGLIQDPHLASCFVWYAEKAYKFNGDSYIRFYHEP
ncbi:hypothetical protein DFH07DRAFT_748588, partial [Mycena maculata]